MAAISAKANQDIQPLWKNGKQTVLDSIRKQIEEAESKRKYLAVGNMRALARDIEDEAYDATED